MHDMKKEIEKETFTVEAEQQSAGSARTAGSLVVSTASTGKIEPNFALIPLYSSSSFPSTQLCVLTCNHVR